MSLDYYISNMVENLENIPNCLPSNTTPQYINLCLEGGAFAGAYQAGALLLVKELEKKNYMIVHKISGVSVGALIGIGYLTDTLHSFITYDTMIRKCWKDETHYEIIRDILHKVLYNQLQHYSDCSLCNVLENRLYITFYDCQKSRFITKSKYKNKKDIFTTLLKTIHIPCISNKNRDICFKVKKRKNKKKPEFSKSSFTKYKYFLDGGMPIVFTNTHPSIQTLVLSISNLYFSKDIVCTKNETNSSIIVIEGLLYMYSFIKKKTPNTLCYFYENQMYIMKQIYVIKRLCMYCILFCVSYIQQKLHKNSVSVKECIQILLQLFYTPIVYLFQINSKKEFSYHSIYRYIYYKIETLIVICSRIILHYISEYKDT